ncbi:MAG: glycosyltransferase family 61 protein, partial [Gluconobacter albidus]
RIYYVTPVVYHPEIKSPTPINKLHERITKNIKKTNLKRIFVSRCPPDQRFLRNHAEIENILSKLGFQTLIIRDQSFDEQVEFFSNAEIIVGCMGAAMTNIIFADSGTQIIMLAPEGWLEPYYWDLASVRNLKYAAIYGEPDNRALPAHQTSYEINPGKLVDFIQKLCPEYSF